uniref:Uncharacterized protein n=1 Tax=Faxonius propinquus nudivirus TaxID=3139431 RepID=A0AAU8GD34_9VIRU
MMKIEQFEQFNQLLIKVNQQINDIFVRIDFIVSFLLELTTKVTTNSFQDIYSIFAIRSTLKKFYYECSICLSNIRQKIAQDSKYKYRNISNLQLYNKLLYWQKILTDLKNSILCNNNYEITIYAISDLFNSILLQIPTGITSKSIINQNVYYNGNDIDSIIQKTLDSRNSLYSKELVQLFNTFRDENLTSSMQMLEVLNQRLESYISEQFNALTEEIKIIITPLQQEMTQLSNTSILQKFEEIITQITALDAKIDNTDNEETEMMPITERLQNIENKLFNIDDSYKNVIKTVEEYKIQTIGMNDQKLNNFLTQLNKDFKTRDKLYTNSINKLRNKLIAIINTNTNKIFTILQQVNTDLNTLTSNVITDDIKTELNDQINYLTSFIETFSNAAILSDNMIRSISDQILQVINKNIPNLDINTISKKIDDVLNKLGNYEENTTIKKELEQIINILKIVKKQRENIKQIIEKIPNTKEDINQIKEYVTKIDQDLNSINLPSNLQEIDKLIINMKTENKILLNSFIQEFSPDKIRDIVGGIYVDNQIKQMLEQFKIFNEKSPPQTDIEYLKSEMLKIMKYNTDLNKNIELINESLKKMFPISEEGSLTTESPIPPPRKKIGIKRQRID